MSQAQGVLESTPTGRSWALDPAHSLVEFSVRHMMITTVRGRFGQVSGTLVLDPGHSDGGSVEVELEAASIDTGSEQRDAHLRSADFLDADSHARLSFRSRRVEGAPSRPGDRFRVIGDLTIRGITREVTLDAVYEGRGTDPWGAERVSYSAETRVDRRDFGLTWNQALETGGVLVANEVRIHLEVQAIPAA